MVRGALKRYDSGMDENRPEFDLQEQAEDNPLANLGPSQSLLGEFWSFIKHNKLWWMTPIILVLVAMVAFILFAESAPVLPFVYGL